MSEPMSERELQAIQERCNRATEGPWVWTGESFTAQEDADRAFASLWAKGSLEFHCVETRDSAIANLEAAEGRAGRAVFPAITGNGPNSYNNANFIAHARQDIPNLIAGVRRSHVENAALRQKVRELEGEEVIEHPIVLKASLACAENQRDYYYQIWQQQTTELRERVGELEDALRPFARESEIWRQLFEGRQIVWFGVEEVKAALAALSPKQEEEEEGI